MQEGNKEIIEAKTKNQRNAENNAKAVKVAADVASKTSNPYAKAIGEGIKIADKVSGGKASENLGKALNTINKRNGIQGKMLQAALNKMGESGTTDRIGAALSKKNSATQHQNKQSSPLSSLPEESNNTGDNGDEPTEGFVNFKISPQAIKVLLWASVPTFIVIVFCCLFIAASQTYINVIGIGSADESINIDDKIQNSTDEERNEEITDENLGAYNVTIKRKNYANPYILTTNTVRKNTEIDLSNLEDYYGANSDTETINGFFYKLRDIYKRYQKVLNVKLDLPLIMSTLILQDKDMDVVFKSNISESYDRTNIDELESHILDYEHDWSGYIISQNTGAHDIEILAQNMVTKGVNNRYSIDYDRYDKFLKVFLDKKYYSEKAEIYNGTNEDLDNYEFNNESGVNILIAEIYDAKGQYEDLLGLSDNKTIINAYNNMFWWPIGSKETEEKNGVLFAIEEPQLTYITSYYAAYDGFRTDAHGGIDIGNGGNGPGVVNIIAAKAGEVVYPLNDSQIQYVDHPPGTNNYGNGDGGGYGNYVKIKHSDGTYTFYAHMAQGSITVRSGDVVSQGQVIGKMGNSGSSTGTHLHFEVRAGSDSQSSRTNPLDYVDPENPRPISSGSGSNFSLTTTILTKAEFIARMNDYYTRSKNQNFYNNFGVKAAEIYDSSIEYNVNPELVVVTAGTEQGWNLSSACQYTNNYWGIGITNGEGCNAGGKYSSLTEGIKAYADVLSTYSEFGSMANDINTRYEDRASAGCDPSGHGMAGTLEGMQSLYSWVGHFRYNPGDWGIGGCKYLNIIYGANYCSTVPTCYDKNNCSEESRTSVCEQNDYTAFQLKQKHQLRYDIFGL